MKSNFKLANNLLRNGNYDKSKELYLDLIDKFPDFSPYYLNASIAFSSTHHYLKAREFYLNYVLKERNYDNGFIKPNWWELKSSHITKNTVVIIVPMYNSENTIEECISSLQNQTYKDIIIIIVDDNSTDKSLEIAREICRKDKRIFLLEKNTNQGPFTSVNHGLYLVENENFGYFIKHDADDLMKPERIKKQLEKIKDNQSLMLCTSGYTRVDALSREVISGKKRGHNMTLYKKEVFEKLGYYDNRRFGADSEYLERALLRFGKHSEANISERLTIALYNNNNITAKNPLGSPLRTNYQNYIRSLHLKMKKINSWRISFTPYKNVKNNITPQVVCGIATLKDRFKALEETIASLLPQVDKLIIYQNDYKKTDGIFEDKKITVISALDTNIDHGDAGKYFKLGEYDNCYYFSCDDDLIYPSNYVETLISYLKSMNNSVIATCHGRIMTRRPKSYYKDKIKVFHFANETPENSFVHFGGTGVMAFHSSLINLNFNSFIYPNMADIWVGLYAIENGIPISVIPHGKNWIRHSDKFDISKTIFRSHEGRTQAQDKIIEGMEFSHLNTIDNKLNIYQREISPASKESKIKIGIAIPTFNRHKYLERFLHQINQASLNYDTSVIIKDDGSLPKVSINHENFKNISSIKLIRTENQGKKGYWKTVNLLFNELEKITSDYYFYLADDTEIKEDFFHNSIETWLRIKDKNKISMNLLNDGRTKCWTNFERELIDLENVKIFKSQWLDMIMMFDKKLLEYRVNEIPLSRWENRPNLSSGVGAQLSTRLHDEGFNMYQVFDSLVSHGDHESMMNPEERIINPLVTR